MVDAMRKQLDQLMGANRNGDMEEVVKRNFWDSDVCRPYLSGLCPRDLFTNTKIDEGECDKFHDPQLKTEYEAARKTKDYGYDYDLEHVLEKYVGDCDRKITKAQKRLEDNQDEPVTVLAVSKAANNPEVERIAVQIQEKLKEAETLGEQGEVEKALLVTQEVEDLRQQKANEQAKALLASLPFNKEPQAGGDDQRKIALDTNGMPLRGAGAANQKLRVCDVCGAFLSIYDSDRRLADHFGGKLHLGYLQIRERLKEIREKRKKDRESSSYSRTASSRDYDRRDRDRDHDRERESRKREREPEQHPDRERRDRDRDDGRDRDRGRDYRRDDRDRDSYRRDDRYGRKDSRGDRGGNDRGRRERDF
mmetsp:Transcript_24080/g.39578  ORF Transcript_24080/g.39578 Transcript_24080/m.39578 type:complete len:364 (-) Transcript_24080:533-1624(-)